jgi:hypothetical protein
VSEPDLSPDHRDICVQAVPASDSWGFVGTVSVGAREAYRTLQAFSTPDEALAATERLLGDALGTLLAGQEWRSALENHGHAPRRVELSLGLRGLGRQGTRVDVSSQNGPAGADLHR